MIDQTVGFFIADDLLGVGVKLQGPTAAECNVGQMVDRRHAMRPLGVYAVRVV